MAQNKRNYYYYYYYLLTYLLTHSMEPSSSWETNRFSASQEIPRILWNPKVHYRIHTCPPTVSIIIIIIIIIIDLVTLLSIYLLTNLHLSQIVGKIKFSQGKEFRRILQGQ
jgi:hypothetical protein